MASSNDAKGQVAAWSFAKRSQSLLPSDAKLSSNASARTKAAMAAFVESCGASNAFTEANLYSI
jgi:hypothetical protein